MFMLQFKDIEQRTIKQISQIFPKVVIKPNILKSSPLKSIFKTIQCQTVSTKDFKQCLQGINSIEQNNREQKYLNLHQTLKKTQQYFTACINILQHNEKVRQKYELVLLNDEKEKSQQLKQVRQIIRNSGSINSKSSFLQFSSCNIQKVFGQQQKSYKASALQQVKQVYLPNNPDQYNFVTRIRQDQYLVYNEEVVQNLLIYVNSINRLNGKISLGLSEGLNKQPLTQAQQVLNKLLVDQIFRVQDNKFNQILNYMLNFVRDSYNLIEKKKNSLQQQRNELKQSFIRIYYVVFMARKQLKIVENHIQSAIKQNSHFLKIGLEKANLQKMNKELQDFQNLRQKTKQISDYLCDKQQPIFKLIYDSKIKKIILVINSVSRIISQARKLDNELIHRLQQANITEQKADSNVQKPDVNPTQNERVEDGIQSLTQTVLQLQQDVRKLQASIGSKPPSQDDLSSFNRVIQEIQKAQLRYSQLQQRQLKAGRSTLATNLDERLKQKLIRIQSSLISTLKGMGNDDKPLNVRLNNQAFSEDDKTSVYSVASSKISVFQKYHIEESDIFLMKSPVNKNYLPPLNLQQLMKEANDFITNQFVKNQPLLKELQDKKNINIQKLQSLIHQIQNNSASLLHLNIKPVQPSVNIAEVSSSSKSPEKGRKNKRSKQKSQNKTVNNSSPKKQSQKQSLNKQNQLNNNKQVLLNLKSKLIFISGVLLPQISQQRIPRIFQQNVHTDIFQKFTDILLRYKERIFTEKTYSQAEKYGISHFVTERAQFILTITKNIKSLVEVFNFIRIFSQSKVKFQAIQQNTFDIILKALLAVKQIQAYRKQNCDLIKTGKVSTLGVQFMENQIYIPFLCMFKNLFKIKSQKQQILVFIQQIMENVQKCINLKKQVRQVIDQLSFNSNLVPVELIIQKIHKIVHGYSNLEHYQILKYRKLQAIIKTLRTCLSFQSKSSNQDLKQLITDHLRNQLLKPQEGKTQSLFN